MKTQYYIKLDSYWQNSPDRWVGPYESRAEAQEAVNTSSLILPGQTPADIKEALRFWGRYPKGAALKQGLPTEAPESWLILPSIPDSLSELRQMEEELKGID